MIFAVFHSDGSLPNSNDEQKMCASGLEGQTPRLPKDNAVPDIAFVVSPNLGSMVTRGNAQDAKLSSTSESSSGSTPESSPVTPTSSPTLRQNLDKETYRRLLDAEVPLSIIPRSLENGSNASGNRIGSAQVSATASRGLPLIPAAAKRQLTRPTTASAASSATTSVPSPGLSVVPAVGERQLTRPTTASAAASEWCKTVSSTPYLSDTWLKEFSGSAASSSSDANRRDQARAELEATIEFWESKRKAAERAKIDALGNRLACLLRTPPVLEDPYLKPQPIPQELPYKRPPTKRPLPVLTDRQLEFVQESLRSAGLDTVLVNNFRLAVTRRELMTLTATNWLSDMVINFYMQLLFHRGQRVRKAEGFTLPRVAVMSTFFYAKLSSGTGYQGVRRWTRQINLFEHDLVFFPIHDRGIHWCLAAADLRNKTLTYYDSMGGGNDHCLDILLEYLDAECQDKLKKSLDGLDKWKKINTKNSVPQQENGCDCGVFLCTFAEFLSRGAEFTFSQADMPQIRQRMMYEILTQQLLTTKTTLAPA
nr:unnamed protein product [Spirometra erinaceieuropaei]